MPKTTVYYSKKYSDEPETIDLMTAIGIPKDSTIYYSSTAYEITGTELWAALNAFVLSTKSIFSLTTGVSSLLNQFKFIYPRIGGTGTRHKYNLVDTTTFEGIFSGGWTHDGSGALPNGTNGYMDTQCTYRSTNFSNNDQSFGFDSKTDSNGTLADFGCTGFGFANILMYGRRTGNLSTRFNDATDNTTATSDSLGVLTANRVGSANYKQYKEGSPIATITETSTAMDTGSTTGNIVEAATNNNGSIIFYSPRKRTLFFGGKGMTDQQMSDFVTAWNTFETTLNR